MLPGGAKDDRDPRSRRPVSTNALRQTMSRTGQREGEGAALPFHGQRTRSLREKLSPSAPSQRRKQLLLVGRLDAEWHCATDIS